MTRGGQCLARERKIFFYIGAVQKYLEVNDKPYVFKDFPKIPIDRQDKVEHPEPNAIESEKPKKEEGK